MRINKLCVVIGALLIFVALSGCTEPTGRFLLIENDINVDQNNGNFIFDGNIDMNFHWINNLSDPVLPQDAATKAYVDAADVNRNIDGGAAATVFLAVQSVDGGNA